MKNARALVGAVVDEVGLRAGEPRRDDELRAVQQHVEAQVVSVEGEAPGASGGGRAKEGKVVGELVHHGGRVDERPQEVVYAHGANGLFVALGGERGLEHAEDFGA